MSQSPQLFETIIDNKQSLGGEYSFERDTFEMKLNQHGCNGVFTRRALPKGTDVVSVSISNGGLTPFRAYEEAQELLKKLGSERFNLKDMFVIACAMYLRFTNTAHRDADLLVTVPDLKAAYAGTPMSASDSLAKSQLLNSNNKTALDAAAKMDGCINQMQVDPALFRATLGYVYSRCWGEGHGLLPVLDWFNSAYGDGANCECRFRNGKYAMTLIKDVAADEELVWNYNAADANLTWLSYGFVDLKRPTKTFLLLRMDDKVKAAFEIFALEKLHWSKSRINPESKVDNCEFEFALLAPGAQIPTTALLKHSIAQSVKFFVAARVWFRALIFSSEAVDLNSISPGKLENHILESDQPLFGIDTERQVIAAMHLALSTGLNDALEKIEKFEQSDIGRSIDMSDYVAMIQTCVQLWDNVFTLVESLYAAPDIDRCIPLINTALGCDIQFPETIKTTLDQALKDQPSLLGALIRKTVLGRMADTP